VTAGTGAGWLRALLRGVLALVPLLALFGLFVLFGPVLAVVTVVAMAAAVGFARRSGALTGARELPRALLATSALVANPSDNAYLWLMCFGVLLLGIAIPFALAAGVPWQRIRCGLAQVGVGLVWGVGVPAALLLLAVGPLHLLSGPFVPRTSVDQRVIVHHTVGGLALGAAIWLVGYRWPRRSSRSGPGSPPPEASAGG
jgi:hypothetical protein